MKSSDAIKDIMRKKQITQQILAEMIGYKGQSSIQQALGRDSMKIETLVRMAEGLGYELVLRSAEDEYVINK